MSAEVFQKINDMLYHVAADMSVTLWALLVIDNY